MFNLGGWEWAILLVIVLIVFGVGKLPQIGGAIGQSIREFREASKEEPKEDPEAKTPPADAAAASDATKTDKVG